MRMRAAGSICVICFTASMPPISGMMMSIVTKSGFSCWYFSTACLPFSASPTTVNPACDRMSLTIVRMNTASSQTSTVLLTLPPLSDYLLNHRLDIENQHPPSVDLYSSRRRARHRYFGFTTRAKLIDRHVLNVAHIVDAKANPALGEIHQQDQSFRSLERRSSQRGSAIDDGDDRSAEVDQAADGVGSAGQSRHLARWHDFPEVIHVAGVAVSSQLEHQQAPRRDLWLVLNNFLRRENYGVTHRIGTRLAGRCLREARVRQKLRRARDANPRAEGIENPAACQSLGDRTRAMPRGGSGAWEEVRPHDVLRPRHTRHRP